MAEAIEQEKVNDNVEATVPAKEKVPKESSARYRSKTKVPDTIPKAILKRKRSNNYWVWIASSALCLILLVLAYGQLL